MLPLRPAWSDVEAREVEAEASQRDQEAGQYDGLLGLRLLSLLEIPATLQPLWVSAADQVVESGCGTGRMTRVLARTGARIIACDHSLESLRRLGASLDEAGRKAVQLVRADAAYLPVRDGWATRALSCQMLEHLPSEALRRSAVAELARVLRSEGRLALSAYWHAPALRWLLSREGHHSGKIFFHRFTRAELAGLLEPHFRLDALTGRLVYILLVHARKR